MERGNYLEAEGPFSRALASARARKDSFLEAIALLNLSWSADQLTHFDEALDWADGARKISLSSDYLGVAQTALGNMAWAYYKLGNLDNAEEMFSEASKQAHALGDISNEAGWLTNAGYVHMDEGDLPGARQFFLKSTALARSINSREDILDALIAFALAAEQAGALDDATRYSNEALSMARADRHKDDEDFARLVQGLIAASEHDASAAEAAFHEVEQSNDSPVYLKWDAEHSLARLYEDENQTDVAGREYRTALSTFESARSELKHETSRLAFLNNASGIYDDYIRLLVTHSKTDEALQVAEYQRGRTLAEGLGLLDVGVPKTEGSKAGSSKTEVSKTASSKTNALQKPAFHPGAINPQATARRAGGTILFYSLGEKQSYLWAITPQKTNMFTLPAKAEIDSAVRRYRKMLAAQEEYLSQADTDGRKLYQMLVAPAQAMLPKDAKVFIIPDGSLNLLNFETLLVGEAGDPASHYWIEDATIADASSLLMLDASSSPQRLKPQSRGPASGTAKAVPFPKRIEGTYSKLAGVRPSVDTRAGSLLLIGDAVAASADYPELRKASAEMGSIEKHFPADRQQAFARDRATPAAYLGSKPDQFSYIHFVAHGTASRVSPLDSAIVLSTAGQQGDSFKLYARDIIHQPLHAELVTISTCYGAGARAYSGEGLVGLSWAFLRAGAHNVIGALWEVSDDSTPELMDALYGGLQKGESPDAALRAAKLTMLHSSKFRKPFYWAPFQLYTGSRAPVVT